MTRGSAVGDVLRTIAALQIDDDATAVRIARMLGYTSATLPEQRRRAHGRTAPSSVSATVPAAPGTAEITEGPVIDQPPLPDEVLLGLEETAPDAPAPRLLEVREMPEEEVSSVLPQRPVPASLSLVRAPSRRPADPPQPAPEPADLSSVTAEYVPPWPAPWAPGIAFAAAASMVDLHRVDIGAVVARLARGRRQGRLPTRHRLSGRRGLQLLLDHGDAMQARERELLA